MMFLFTEVWTYFYSSRLPVALAAAYCRVQFQMLTASQQNHIYIYNIYIYIIHNIYNIYIYIIDIYFFFQDGMDWLSQMINRFPTLATTSLRIWVIHSWLFPTRFCATSSMAAWGWRRWALKIGRNSRHHTHETNVLPNHFRTLTICLGYLEGLDITGLI